MGNTGCCGADPSGTVIEQEPMPTQSVLPVATPRTDAENDKAAAPPPAAEPTPAASKPETPAADPSVTTCEFQIKLTRKDPSEPWGLGLRKSAIDDTLLIMKPVGSALEAWEAANPTKTLKKCDEIISVNGQSGSAIIVDTLKSAVELNITLRRQIRITVELTKSGPLGMKVEPGALTVGKLTDGMVMTYNKQCAPTLAINEGDQLISINDEPMTKSEDLLAKLGNFNEGAQMKLVFTRGGVS